MQINQNNYEAFFLDFAEGRLDNSSTLELLNFLRNHPELKQELEQFSDIRLDAPEEVFPGKEVLKKLNFGHASVNPNNFGDFCIAYHEKLLNQAESQKLFSYLEFHPEKKKDFDLFGKATLVADKNIVFEAKPFLKRKPKGASVRTIIFRITAVAAGLILAVTIFYKSSVKEDVPNRVAVTSSNSPKLPVYEQPKNTAVDVLPTTKKDLAASFKPQNSKVKAARNEQPEIVAEDSFTREESLPELAAINVRSLPSRQVERPEFRSAVNVVSPDKDEPEDFELFAYAGKLIQKKILKQDEDKPRKKITLWDLADVTITGYNSITENDIKLHREIDENGKVTALAIESENKKYGFSNKN
jgi:hypothetical protein